MTLEEAQQQIKTHFHLRGTTFRKATIDDFAIIPANGDRLGDIIKHVLYEEPYLHLLAQYDDFNVIVLLDFEQYPDAGFLFYDSIANVLDGRASKNA
jgi:hypothetical protein